MPCAGRDHRPQPPKEVIDLNSTMHLNHDVRVSASPLVSPLVSGNLSVSPLPFRPHLISTLSSCAGVDSHHPALAGDAGHDQLSSHGCFLSGVCLVGTTSCIFHLSPDCVYVRYLVCPSFLFFEWSKARSNVPLTLSQTCRFEWVV